MARKGFPLRDPRTFGETPTGGAGSSGRDRRRARAIDGAGADMTRSQYLKTIGLAFGIGCTSSSPAVRPDQMSADAHRQSAARERQAARDEVLPSRSAASEPSISLSAGDTSQGLYAYPAEMYDPKNEHLARAKRLKTHAEEHEAAAASLEKFEQAECKDFPPVTRAACPLLGPVVELVDVPGGIRARFKDGVRVDAVLAHMRCHYAYARARGFGAAAGCPLYIRGIEIRRASDLMAVEIVARDAAVTAEIRSRAREEAVLVRAGRN